MHTSAYNLIDFDKPVFRSYALWTAILLLKMMYLSVHTAFYRFKNQTFANVEDAGNVRKVRFNDDQVERVRRVHRNDLENVIPGLVIGFLYVLTNPSPAIATLLLKVGALSRIIHSIAYLIPLPQPSRALSWAIHYTAASPEDLTIVRAQQVVTGNEDVERVRRAHLNDLENILPYLIIGLFYVLTDPKPLVSTILFKIATSARIVHTFVYAIYVVPQPCRALAFFVHWGITIYMAFMSFIYFV